MFVLETIYDDDEKNAVYLFDNETDVRNAVEALNAAEGIDNDAVTFVIYKGKIGQRMMLCGKDFADMDACVSS